MRLTDRQYGMFVKTGIALVVISVFAYDWAPPQYHLGIAAVAAIGAILGFFPLATSEPFRSSEKSEISSLSGEDGSICEVVKSADSKDQAAKALGLWAEVHASFREGRETYGAVDIFDSYIARHYGLLASTYDYRADSLYSVMIGRHARSGAEERAERIQEVYHLVNRLRGTPESFSIELTGTNSIVVHCEGAPRSSVILADYEKDPLSSEAGEKNSLKGLVQ